VSSWSKHYCAKGNIFLTSKLLTRSKAISKPAKAIRLDSFMIQNLKQIVVIAIFELKKPNSYNAVEYKEVIFELKIKELNIHG
jgi:hypothetical protein